jgi:hypothetical protein
VLGAAEYHKPPPAHEITASYVIFAQRTRESVEIVALGRFGKPRTRLTGKASLHGRARGQPRYTSPSPLTAEIVAVASPDSAKEADRLLITTLGNFDALLRNIAFQNHVSTKQAAEMLGTTVGTLKSWRSRGLGPKWVKLGAAVRYDVEELLDFIKRNTRVPSVRALVEERRGAL